MRKDIEKVIEILKKEFKNFNKPTVRRTSEKKNPFKTLITCLLSLRTQDRNTAKASASLFKVADTPEKIAKLPIKKLEKLIYSSGYYKNKAKSIKHVSKVILKKYKGKVPSKEEELLSIKGIGRKTANIVLCFAFDKNVIPVDTHVNILANRLGWVKTKNAYETEFALKEILPRKYWKEINTLFVLFGQQICTSLSPKCSVCPIEEYCKKIGVTRSR